MTTPAKATRAAIAAMMLIHGKRIHVLYYRNLRVINGAMLERSWSSKAVEMNQFTAVNEFAAGI